MKSKRAGFGTKLYQLCTSNETLLDFIAIHGNIILQLIEMEEGVLIIERIAPTLLKKYFSKGHYLYTDNFYTSPTFANYIVGNGSDFIRTISENRKQIPLE